MNEPHIAPSELEAFLRGGLQPERVLAVGRHLSGCSDCRAAAGGEAAARRAAANVLRDDDLDADPVPAPRRWVYALAAAAVLAFVAFLAVLMTRRPAPPSGRVIVAPPAADAREVQWQSLVDDALRNGLAEPAALRELAPRRGALRGSELAPNVQLEPRGVVVEETRPVFRWSSAGDARHRVFVFDGTRQVAASPELRATEWRCDAELTRGRTYLWQLEITMGGRQEVAPAASIRIADAATASELAAARARHPRDPLLLGILYARHGIVDAAERELRLAARTDRRAAKLLGHVLRWRASVAEADQGV